MVLGLKETEVKEQFSLHDKVRVFLLEEYKSIVLFDNVSGSFYYLNDNYIQDIVSIKKRLESLGFTTATITDRNRLEETWRQLFLKKCEWFTYSLVSIKGENISNIFNLLEGYSKNNKIKNVNLEINLENNIPTLLESDLRKILLNKLCISLNFYHLSPIEVFDNILSLLDKISEFTCCLERLNFNFYIRDKETLNYINEVVQHIQKINICPTLVTLTYLYDDSSSLILLREIIDDYIWKQLFSSISNILIIPTSSDISIKFKCIKDLDLRKYYEIFSFILENELLTFCSIDGGSILSSLRFFLNTKMFIPPNFYRCNAGHFLCVTTSNYSFHLCPFYKVGHLSNKDLQNFSLPKIRALFNSDIINAQDNFAYPYGANCPYIEIGDQEKTINNILETFFLLYHERIRKAE